MNQIVVHHVGPTCVQCNMTKRQLEKHNIAYVEIDLRERTDLMEKFKAQGHLTAPVVTTATDIWSGFRIDKINALPKGDKLNGN